MPGPRVRTGKSFEDVGSGFYQYLSTDGAGGGTTNADGNYATPTQFYIQDTGRYLAIERLILYVEDVGSMDSGQYGNGLTPSNGIRLEILEPDDTLVHDVMAGNPVTKNLHWQGKCHDLTMSSWGSGNTGYSVRWTFAKAGKPIILAPGQKLAAILEDNYTGLVEHRFQVQGHYL